MRYFLLPTLLLSIHLYSMDKKTANEITKLEISPEEKAVVSHCILASEGCDQIPASIMNQIKIQNSQIAAAIYLSKKRQAELEEQKKLVSAYYLHRRECFQNSSPQACQFLINHEKELLKAQISNPAEIEKAREKVPHHQCPFFSE